MVVLKDSFHLSDIIVFILEGLLAQSLDVHAPVPDLSALGLDDLDIAFDLFHHRSFSSLARLLLSLELVGFTIILLPQRHFFHLFFHLLPLLLEFLFLLVKELSHLFVGAFSLAFLPESDSNTVKERGEECHREHPARYLSKLPQPILVKNERTSLHIDLECVTSPVLGHILRLARKRQRTGQNGPRTRSSEHVEHVFHRQSLDLLICGCVHIERYLVVLANGVVVGVPLHKVEACGWDDALNAAAIDGQDVVGPRLDNL